MSDRPNDPVAHAAWLQRLVLALLGLLAVPGLLALWTGTARAGSLPGELPALVGRLNVEAGTVQLQDRDTGRWESLGEAGTLRNWPVATGDRLRLRGRDARAELHIGSTTLRLGAGAELGLQQLDGQAVTLQLQDGTLALRLAAIDGDAFGPVEVRTREGRWLPRRPGHYRLDREADATQASVWRGELQFEGFDSALAIPEGRRADLWLDGAEGSRRSSTRYAWATIERDAFADWVARDERQDDAPQTARYVPPGITGWQDLDRHGDWVPDSEDGPLWLPRTVPIGWAPYQSGRWAWVAPWGWTWIDAAPWGFAPFHYGRWVRFDNRWAWSPGRGEPHWRGHRDPRVRFAPVLSGWYSGPAVGISVQIGGQRPPPPRVVVPAVPVVVVRPQPPRPLPLPPPAVVVPHRPDRHWDDRRWGDRRSDDRWRDGHAGDDRRWSGPADPRRDDRNDRRPDGRHEGHHDSRDDGRADTRPDNRPDIRQDNRPGLLPAWRGDVRPIVRDERLPDRGGDRRADGPGDRPQEPPRAGRWPRDAAPVAPIAAAPPAAPIAVAPVVVAPAVPVVNPPPRTAPAVHPVVRPPATLAPVPPPVPAAIPEPPRMGVPRPQPRGEGGDRTERGDRSERIGRDMAR